jgi:Protein of unknown function (DUF3592)
MKAMDAFGFIALLIPLGIGFIIWWFLRGKDFFRERRSAGWPLVAARVENFEVAEINAGTFKTILYYSYSAQDQFYTGTFARLLPSQEAADSAGSDWQDCQIMVRYNPADASQSVFVEKGDLNTGA